MTRRASALSTVAVGLAALALVACGDDGTSPGDGGGRTATSGESTTVTGTTTSSTTTAGGGGDCGPLYGLDHSADCNTCMDDACCDAIAACAANQHCERISRCWEHCDGELDCVLETCPDDAYDTPFTMDVRICQVEQCAGPCGFDPIDCGALKAPYDAADRVACDACLGTACCDALQGIVSPEATRFEACRLGCLDGECLRGCEIEHPEGLAALSGLHACVFGTCGDACNAEGSCGFPVPANACGLCHEERCCGATTACVLDVGCVDLAACTSGTCTTLDDCDVCLDLWPPEQVGILLSGNGCLGASCADVCSAPACGRVRRLDDADCESCLEASCCAEASACGSDAGCIAHEVCLERCEGDPACATTCAEQHPEGAALFAPLVACAADACAATCPDPLR